MRSAFGNPDSPVASRWANASAAAAVTALSTVAGYLPGVLQAPTLTIPALALFGGASVAAPLAAAAKYWAPAAADRPTSGALRWLRPEVAFLAFRLLTNLRHGVITEPAALATHWAAQAALDAALLTDGSWPQSLAHTAAWLLPEASRFGAMWGAEQAFRTAARVEAMSLNDESLQWVSNSTACNSLGAACAQPVGAIAFPGTHLSFSADANSFWHNQVQSVEQQFADGIRLFLLEPNLVNNELFSGHGTFVRFAPLVDHFRRLRVLLDAHPKEVIVVKLSPQGASVTGQNVGQYNALIAQASVDSGLGTYAIDFDPNSGVSLQALIAANLRVLWVDNSLAHSAIMPRFVRDIRPQDIAMHGATSGSLLNAFTTYIWPITSQATNRQLPEIWRRATNALAETGNVPNLVAVNDYQTSSVIALARAQNIALQ